MGSRLASHPASQPASKSRRMQFRGARPAMREAKFDDAGVCGRGKGNKIRDGSRQGCAQSTDGQLGSRTLGSVNCIAVSG